ncbi:hypothetical protein C5E02_11265 [Rathayibacter rathayi]|uniref:Uncharacterized protein n=1 Tax=Rathayibacter rathayi TaxID=33887 RepID=A0ABD6W6W1_RATRA|nr:hypothetical protein C5C04_11030 [Rathayibacter rathayi]PPF46607.1 hypothetical protein C5C08_11345 [Rathayibacter rathayi]PPH65669.1 hypothetical protein C5C45_11690 [Rathayibacter rathayi]PPH99697.1 hypothetical protein C5C43_11175 [Rathayibacter rathayi]PPI08033.1 hypothetical protein C5D23_11135 [Rathayibacter rathayi]
MAARRRHRGPGSGTDSDSAPRSSCTDFWLTRGLLLATFLVTTWATFSTLTTLSPAAGLSRPTPLISPYVLALSIPFGFFAAIAVSAARLAAGRTAWWVAVVCAAVTCGWTSFLALE